MQAAIRRLSLLFGHVRGSSTGDERLTVPNPDLVVDGQTNLAGWLSKDRVRKTFRTPSFSMQAITMRAPHVLQLRSAPDARMKALPAVQAACNLRGFSAMVVCRGQDVLFERYAPDCNADQPQSLQSMTKTMVHLIVGRLVEEGKLDLNAKVSEILPEVGSGYAEATLQRVMDMRVRNNFQEGYGDAYRLESVAEHGSLGYNRMEIAMGWRLYPPEEDGQLHPKPQRVEGSIRRFASQITRSAQDPGGYKSPNNDIMGWAAERASGRSLRSLLQEVVAATGIAGSFFCSCDEEFVPITSGGGFMTARDLARYGQLFCRHGVGVSGQIVGSALFTALSMSRDSKSDIKQVLGPGSKHPDVWYKNQIMSDGVFLGHEGFGGQWMAAVPELGLSIALLSTDLSSGPVDMVKLTREIIGHVRRPSKR